MLSTIPYFGEIIPGHLLFPHRYGAVVRAVAVGIEAGAGCHLDKVLVKGGVCHAYRHCPAYGKEAGAYSCRIFVPVCVKRH